MSAVLDRQLLRGLAFLAVLAGVVLGAVALYRGDFRSTVPVTVVADRAGLTMEAGAPVKLRGVEVGTVASVRPDGDQVRIRAHIDTGRLADIPADVSAQLVPPTAFGSKYVQLTPGADPTAARLRAGDVIGADRVTVEINQTFTHLTELLDAARPAEVSNALNAVAGAVDERGAQIGALVTQVDDYLRAFNPSLARLADDLRRAEAVAATYRKALPDLLTVADRSSVTATTLTREQASLRAFLVSLQSASGRTDALLQASSRDLTSSLRRLDPVTAVLARYSSELPCLVPGVVRVNQLAEKAVGGGQFPGIVTFTGIQHQDEPYRYPANLPLVGDRRGPGCYGLPVVSAGEAALPNPVFRTGANPYTAERETPSDNLSQTFFGVLAGLVNFG